MICIKGLFKGNLLALIRDIKKFNIELYLMELSYYFFMMSESEWINVMYGPPNKIDNRLTELHKIKENKLRELQEIKEMKLKNNRDKTFKVLDNVFTSYEEIKEHANSEYTNYIVTLIYIGRRGSIRNYTIKNDYGVRYEIDNYYVSYNEICEYLKNKSIPGLGGPKYKKMGFFSKNMKFYYEW